MVLVVIVVLVVVLGVVVVAVVVVVIVVLFCAFALWFLQPVKNQIVSPQKFTHTWQKELTALSVVPTRRVEVPADCVSILHGPINNWVYLVKRECSLGMK